MNRPRFIYFDLGNVLFTFDHRIACQRLAQRTGLRANHFQELIFESGLQQQYEAGAIGSKDFAGRIARDSGDSLDAAAILEICSDIFQPNQPMLSLVRHLAAAGHRLGILSNTCPAHWEWIDDGRYADSIGQFELRVLSYETKSLKPAAEIYQAAIQAANVAAEDIFFTDDRPENVHGARSAGLDAVRFTDLEQLTGDLGRRNIHVTGTGFTDLGRTSTTQTD